MRNPTAIATAMLAMSLAAATTAQGSPEEDREAARRRAWEMGIEL